MSLIYILKQVLRRGLVSYLYLFIFLLISVNMAINSVILSASRDYFHFRRNSTKVEPETWKILTVRNLTINQRAKSMELNLLQHPCYSRFSESLTLLDWKNCTGPQCNSRNVVAQVSEICTLSVSNCHLVSSSLFGKPVKVNKKL